MAGGKETPRQKMIGMMYLVLTALLALNVSTTVLDKFAFINQSLEQANSEVKERNTQILAGMKQAVKDKGNRPEDLKITDAAEALREKTQSVLQSLEESKETFVEITGGYEEGKEGDKMHIQGKTNYDKVGHYMTPKEEGGEGNGAAMKELLNGYSDFVRDLLRQNGATQDEIERYHPLAVDANDDPYWSQDPNQRGKKWSQLQFHDSPTHAALATVSEFQANVLGYETAAMDYLKKRVGLKDLTFDEIYPIVMPESKYVAAGTKYKAEMFITASSSGLKDKLVMKYNGNDIPVKDGIGIVEFTATPATQYDDEGKAKKSFEASITVPQGGGNDTTFTSTVEYFVTNPVIQIQSQSVNALYYNCGNKLDVQVPALGASYAPSFTASGGVAIPGSPKGSVTVVPKSGKVVLTVSSGGNKIGSREFNVRQIPAPEITPFSSDGKQINLKLGISARTPKIFVKPIPDESFKQFLPDDAKFRIAQAEVTLVSGGLGRKTIRVGEEINVASLGARKGDNIVIEIKKVERQNFRKEVEDFPKFTRFISIPLN